MSPSIFRDAETQWLADVKAMRDALADLKLPKELEGDPALEYGHDLILDDGTESTPNRDDDLWESSSEWDTERGHEATSNGYHSTTNGATQLRHDFGIGWLGTRCTEFVKKNSGFDVSELQDQIMALLASDTNSKCSTVGILYSIALMGRIEDEMQSLLTDILGFDDLNFVTELLLHREKLIRSSRSPVQAKRSLLHRLQTKEERENALGRLDFEHKHAALAPSVNRDGQQYPHVYKSHQAGNTLSASGRKYALPVGSERKDYPVTHCCLIIDFRAGH